MQRPQKMYCRTQFQFINNAIEFLQAKASVFATYVIKVNPLAVMAKQYSMVQQHRANKSKHWIFYVTQSN